LATSSRSSNRNGINRCVVMRLNLTPGRLVDNPLRTGAVSEFAFGARASAHFNPQAASAGDAA